MTTAPLKYRNIPAVWNSDKGSRGFEPKSFKGEVGHEWEFAEQMGKVAGRGIGGGGGGEPGTPPVKPLHSVEQERLAGLKTKLEKDKCFEEEMFRTAVERASCGAHKLLRMARSPRLLNIVVLVYVADSPSCLCG